MAEHREPGAPSVDRQAEIIGILADALWFYADPGSYFALMVVADPPSGAFAEDFDENYADFDDQLQGERYGKHAREALRRVQALTAEDLLPPTGRVELVERSNTDTQPDTTPAAQPSPAAVVDYTERARELLSGCVGTTHLRAGDPDAGRRISDERLVNRVANALSAVASEHQAARATTPLHLQPAKER